MYYLELKLTETEGTSGCSSNLTDDNTCAGLYNGSAKLCKLGECRCLSNISYYSNNTCGMFKILE